MKPGATIRPRASITSLPSLAGMRPILAMRPFLIPMSPRMRGARVPSMIIPSLMTMSNSGISRSPHWVGFAYHPCFALLRRRIKKRRAYQASVCQNFARQPSDRLAGFTSGHSAATRASSILLRVGLQFDAQWHDNPHHRVGERDVHRQLHDAAVVQGLAQRIEGPVADLDVGGDLGRVAHHCAL